MGIKSALRKYFPDLVDWRNRIYNDLAHRRFKNKSVKQVFEEIYEANHWRDDQSKSGTGSNLTQTQQASSIVESIIKEFNCKSMLDIPCGDFNWMKDVTLGDCKYYGADIVDALVTKNQIFFGDGHHTFFCADLTCSELPKVDLIFCRDCLVHLSYENIVKALTNIKRSGNTYLLTTTFPNHSNFEIVTGNWRPLNLQSNPFDFPSPLKIFNEKCTEDPRYNDKSLALWRIKDLT